MYHCCLYSCNDYLYLRQECYESGHPPREVNVVNLGSFEVINSRGGTSRQCGGVWYIDRAGGVSTSGFLCSLSAKQFENSDWCEKDMPKGTNKPATTPARVKTPVVLRTKKKALNSCHPETTATATVDVAVSTTVHKLIYSNFCFQISTAYVHVHRLWSFHCQFH